MGFQEDWQEFVDEIKKSVIDTWHVNVNIYEGELKGFTENGEIDWPVVKQKSTDNTQGEVNLMISCKISLLDGDCDLFLNKNIPGIDNYTEALKNRIEDAMSIRRQWLDALANLAKLANIIPGV